MIGQKPSREVLAACLFSMLAGSTNFAEPPTASGVTTATVPPRTVVFVHHEGPYWGIAKKLQTVRDYMSEHDLSGPLLIRYAADPTRTGGSSIAMEIGFAFNGKHAPSPPFEKETWEGELVAITRVQAGSAGLASACRRIRAWARSRDFVPTGAVIEMFGELAGPGTAPGRTTIQMAIRPTKRVQPEANPVESKPRGIPAHPPEPTDTQIQPSPPKPTGLAKEKPIEGSPKRLTPGPPVAEPVATTETIRPVSGIRNSAKVSTNPVTRIAEPKNLPQKGVQHSESESLAKRLVPPPSNLDSQARAWLGQVVLRLRAISRGTKRLHSENGAAIIGLCDSVVNRYDQLYGESNQKPPSAAHATGPADTAMSQRQKAVMRDLDRFMAILGSKSLSISETGIRFRRIINQAAEIVSTLVGRER